MDYKTSLIIATYNWEAALELCLNAVKYQTKFPDEVIVADDGSRETTAALIREFQQDFPVPLHHVWQEDKGFRLAAIRNKALLKASHPLILQIDGDIIMHPRFVAEHCRFARKGYYTRGVRAALSETETRLSFEHKKLHFKLSGQPLKKWPNVLSVPFLQNAFALFGYKGKGVIGCNLAYWRADAFQVNGFNNDFTGWGKEDDEFCLRLENAGVQKRTLKFGAIAYHLHHPVSAISSVQKNTTLLEQTRREKIRVCKNGLKVIPTG